MAEQNLTERWRDYRPTKTALFWACAASIALTMIVGFSWGGWVTAGTAGEMAEAAADDATAKLAATVCVEQFLENPDARTQLASLKEADLWNRGNFVEEGGWATMPGMEEPIDAAADLCANQLAEMELPAKEAAAKTGGALQ